MAEWVGIQRQVPSIARVSKYYYVLRVFTEKEKTVKTMRALAIPSKPCGRLVLSTLKA